MMQISLKAARVNAKMTQKDVAETIRVSPASVSKWESYKASPPADAFAALCRLYDVSMNDIFLPEKLS